uniref:Uncharacterized protein n=1 Tax=Tetranychus urticae TaxID=32264 RepID=T1K6P5_TETUR
MKVSSNLSLYFSTILYLEDNCGGFADDPFVELLKLNPPTTSRRRLLVLKVLCV